MERLERFETLVGIMDRLRDPDGCPWDREQTYESLRGYLIEECFEVAEAIDHADAAALREELGDLLFQIVFLSRLGKEQGAFEAADVVRGIAEKMIRRHPHVFGDETADTADQVLENWERIKRAEKRQADPHAGDPRSVLDGIPAGLPALLKAQRIGTKAARVGFDWVGPADVLVKIREELGELTEAVGREDRDAAREELGDLLFSIVNLARHLAIDPESALQQANRKFVTRFAEVERELERSGERPEDAGAQRLEQLWARVKRGSEQRDSPQPTSKTPRRRNRS